MRRTFIAFLISASSAIALVTFACSEATDGVAPETRIPGTDGGGASETGMSSNDGAAASDTRTITTSAVLLNEISANEEWIELVSSGTAAIDVSGFRVADTAKDGGPKLDESVTFPAGTVLSPRAYVIVQGGGLDGGGKACPDGGQAYCFNAEFGISNKNGDTIYLLDKAGIVVGTAAYPPMAVPAGESWGRVPSGDPKGVFGANLPATPGAANKAK